MLIVSLVLRLAAHRSSLPPSLMLLRLMSFRPTHKRDPSYYTAPHHADPLGQWPPSARHGRTTRICPSAYSSSAALYIPYMLVRQYTYCAVPSCTWPCTGL